MCPRLYDSHMVTDRDGKRVLFSHLEGMALNRAHSSTLDSPRAGRCPHKSHFGTYPINALAGDEKQASFGVYFVIQRSKFSLECIIQRGFT